MKIGQTFSWRFLDGSKEGTATVLDIRSDRQEGLAPEAEEYAASWMQARSLENNSSSPTLTFMLGTDGRAYHEGREVKLSSGQASQDS